MITKDATFWMSLHCSLWLVGMIQQDMFQLPSRLGYSRTAPARSSLIYHISRAHLSKIVPPVFFFQSV